MNDFALPNIKFTPKFYTMDPQTEILIPDGEFLRDGMKVLVESSTPRVDVSKPMRDWEMERALENNQWCTVSYVKVDHYNNVVHFVGTYEDGTQKKRSYAISYAWLVKKDSVDLSENPRYQKVLGLVCQAMGEALTAERSSDPNGCKIDHVTSRADEITREILDVL
jgi:hypothetical protein